MCSSYSEYYLTFGLQRVVTLDKDKEFEFHSSMNGHRTWKRIRLTPLQL